MTRPFIAACLIVRDGVETLPTLLRSVLPHVDGVFVYDTGSTDGTVELLRGTPGVTVTEGEWRGNFAWAREQSFAMAEEADWILWLDADDELVGGEHLRSLAKADVDGPGSDRQVDGYRLPYLCGEGRQWFPVRLVRRSASWCWVEPVHERLLGGDVVEEADEPFVIHRGVEDGVRNLRILEAQPTLSDQGRMALAYELHRAGRLEESRTLLKEIHGLHLNDTTLRGLREMTEWAFHPLPLREER